MNIVDRYILENLDENIIVITKKGGVFLPLNIKGIGAIENEDSFLIEKDCVKHILRTYGSTWAHIDYLHKYDKELATKEVFSLPRYFRKIDLISRGVYNGYYTQIYKTNGRE